MRLLVAIKADYPKHFSDYALRWVGRGGYDLKIFVSKSKQSGFKKAIDDANYHYYLDLDYKVLDTSGLDPKRYAARHVYDLLLVIPEELESWKKRLRFKEKEIYEYVDAIGKTRVWFGQHPKAKIKRFSNGAIMYRVESINVSE